MSCHNCLTFSRAKWRWSDLGHTPSLPMSAANSRAELVRDYHKRHAVLPGITGWTQVNGWRGETIVPHQIEQRVRYDLEYIERRSARFDLRILLLTFCRIGRDAAF
jgi:lipopolysaccharide/colanic/teichoic acid biosynthesis glycosyltransferase